MAPVKTLRQEQAAATRARIVEAAERVFVERGYAGARLDEIAAEASVAIATVYKVFTNKRNLLVAVTERAMTGGDFGMKVDEQDWWKEQIDEPNPERQLELIARNAAEIYYRASAILEVVRAAAPLERRAARVWSEIESARMKRSHRTARRFVRRAGRKARFSVDETTLTLTSLTAPELYTTHMRAGRSRHQYEHWLADVLKASLLS